MIAILLIALSSAPPPDSSAAAAGSRRAPAAESSVVVPVLTLPEVRVDRERPALDARHREPTGFVSDIRAGDTGHAFETLGELVSRSAAVRIQQYGGLGSFTTVSLRGAAAGQLAMYLDGVPLTSAAGSVVDLSSLPATAIDRLEVYRGAVPLELGPATPGGAINIVTLPPSQLRRLSLVRGSFGSWEGLGTAGGRRGAWSALLHAGYQGTRGDFGYRDDNGTPFNLADDAASVRQNNRFDSRTALATVKGPLPLGLALTLRQSLFDKAQGLPGIGAIPTHASHLALARSLSLLELSRSASGASPALGLQASLDRSRTRFTDLEGELGFGAFETDDRFAGRQLRLTAVSPQLARLVAVESSALLREERQDLHDAASGRSDPPESRRVTDGASLGLALAPRDGRALLRAGWRSDRQHDALRWTGALGDGLADDRVRTFDSPQLGARVRLARGLTAQANWVRTQRAPEFIELFGNEGSVRGNPLLAPERSENWDAGGRWEFAPRPGVRGSLEWAHFAQHAQDLIAYAQNSANTVKALNVSRARLRGEELTARFELPRGVTLVSWVTWLGTLDQGDVPVWRGRSLPERPERHAFAELAWRSPRFDLSAELEYLSADYMDRANRMPVSARTLTGVSAGARVLPGTRLLLEAKNLGDEHVSDVAGFPLPGRSLFLSCEWDAGSRAHP